MAAVNDVADGVTWPDRMFMISLMVTGLIVAAWLAPKLGG